MRLMEHQIFPSQRNCVIGSVILFYFSHCLVSFGMVTRKLRRHSAIQKMQTVFIKFVDTRFVLQCSSDWTIHSSTLTLTHSITLSFFLTLPSTPSTETIFFADPEDCASYCECSSGNAFHFHCVGGLVFDDINNICNWPTMVDCGDRPVLPKK